MTMFLKVTPEGKFSSFGLSSVPVSLLTTSPPITSTNPLKTDLDRAIDSVARTYFRDPRARGLSIGLIKDGRPYMYHYGEIKKGSGKLPTSRTGYEIGSVTKTFTALLLAQAVMDRKVALSDDIRAYLPGDYPNLQFDNQPVTLQDLANHTARLPPMPPNIGNQPGYHPATPEANYDSSLFYGALHLVKLDTLPGYKFDYSNWGMALLGHILETIYHRPYGELLKQYITKPLGMRQTTYQQLDTDKNRMAFPYTENGREFSFQDEGFLGPAGAIHSDLADMMVYLQAQIAEQGPTIRLTHQPTRNDIGLGWGVRNTGSYRDIQHNGSTPGFTTHISAFPELGSGCVILTNSKANLGPLILGTQALLKRKK
ncbi:serine hydrolase [Spirosoma sp. HMF3257]|nr:serine hydrolase [Spirosoma telluris]